ncbi:MAG: hypothetical protein HW380_1444, partial [Magnetococcales bacterium]|nr:hypothetical protein [Magnetococcales bacterium]
STTASIATGWNDSCRVGVSPTERMRLITAHGTVYQFCRPSSGKPKACSLLVFRTYLCDYGLMNGNELIRKLRKYAKDQGGDFRFISGHGKGSHGRIYLGQYFTTIKNRQKEIQPGLLSAMLKQLGLTRQDIES